MTGIYQTYRAGVETENGQRRIIVRAGDVIVWAAVIDPEDHVLSYEKDELRVIPGEDGGVVVEL